jgi:hypothetical protein
MSGGARRCSGGCGGYVYDRDTQCPRCGTPVDRDATTIMNPTGHPTTVMRPISPAPPLPPAPAVAAAFRRGGPARWGIFLLLLAACAFFVGQSYLQNTRRLNGPSTAQQIRTELEQRTGVSVQVTCPDMPGGRGKIADCRAQAAGEPAYLVRVTQDDDNGHYTWQLTAQQAP